MITLWDSPEFPSYGGIRQNSVFIQLNHHRLYQPERVSVRFVRKPGANALRLIGVQ